MSETTVERHWDRKRGSAPNVLAMVLAGGETRCPEAW